MSTLLPHRLKEPVNSLDTQPLPSVGYLIWGVKRPSKRHAGQFTRLAVLEARASKRANIYQTLYLPVIFFVYGVALGELWCVCDYILCSSEPVVGAQGEELPPPTLILPLFGFVRNPITCIYTHKCKMQILLLHLSSHAHLAKLHVGCLCTIAKQAL